MIGKCIDCGAGLEFTSGSKKRCDPCQLKYRESYLVKYRDWRSKKLQEGKPRLKKSCSECGAVFSTFFARTVCCSSGCKEIRQSRLTLRANIIHKYRLMGKCPTEEELNVAHRTYNRERAGHAPLVVGDYRGRFRKLTRLRGDKFAAGINRAIELILAGG